ncbi:Calx-beta domain-containing protein, partial [Methylobacterium trifolii]|uniref:Calx-beta domain-containing protein n=1 Tax=Methylobacterium trifolii TaxID=1003092 RepID=UPI0024B5F272
MATVTVATYADLVSAINAANASTADDTIILSANITLTGTLPTLGIRDAQGAVIASGALTINGGSHTLNGNNQYRLLFANAGTINVNGLTLSGGLAKGGDGGAGQLGESGGGGMGAGGGLYVRTGTSVNLTDVSFSANAATGGSGGADNADGSSGNEGAGGGGLGGSGASVSNLNYGGGGGAFAGQNASGTTGGGIYATSPSGDLSGSSVSGGTGGYGGGGAGGYNNSGSAPGGAGGFGGGGGGAAFFATAGAGIGGFGGGGGSFDGNRVSIGGFGGGNGGNGGSRAAGGGGAAFGADVFVQQGGVLTISGQGTLAAGTSTAGNAGAVSGTFGVLPQNGQSAGSGLFLQGSGTLTYAPAATQTLTVGGAIEDEVGFVARSGYVPPTGTYLGTESWGLTVSGAGTLTLSAANTYTGGTQLNAGTLELGQIISAGSGTIAFTTGAQTLRLDTNGTLGNTLTGFGLGDALDLRTINPTGATFTMTGTTLTVTEAAIAGTDTNTVTINAAPAGYQYALSSDGQAIAGTQVRLEQIPAFSINDVTAAEGNAGTTAYTFTVSLSAASGTTTTVNYATSDGTALAGSDYTATSGTLTFAPGTTSRTITVLANGDTVFEPNESFLVNLSGATNATITDTQGVGTITNDDPAPTIAISDVTVSEAAGTATFTITRTGATEVPITVNYATADGTAIAGSDYTATSGTLTFAPSQAATVTQTVTVAITNDGVFEGSEQFALNFSNATGATITDAQGIGTITDNDPAPVFSIANAPTVTEGGQLVYTVTRTGDAQAAQAVTVITGAAGDT